jgi:PAS domain S-box-containing protein
LLIPISQLSLAAEKLGAESVHAPIPILAHDEIGNLQNTYNFMAKNLLETQDHLSKEVRTSTDASKNLQKSKALLNQVLESIPLSIYWKDLDSRYLGANKQFASNMGLEDPSKLLGKKNEELPIPEHESFTLQELESQMEGLDANVTNTTLRLSNQSGEETWYQVTVLPLKSDQAQLIGILGIMEDLTEKTRSGEELRGIRQLRSMDTFTGSIAHEFRNVLQGLLGQVSCLQVATARDPLSEKYLERTRNQIEIASELSEKLLTITKSGNLPIRHDSIGAILEAAVEESLSNSDTVHILEVDPEIRNVEMERLTLHQIIQNLVLNASQSMDGRGTVELRAMVKKLDSTNEVALPEGSYVFLSVKDQGAGIPEGLRKKIFDPFFSGKDTGTGLGLSTVQALVTKLNGTILVHSTPGMGTEFQVFLPLDVDTPSDVPPPRDFLHGSGRVLVLDDREMVLQTTGEVLTLLGYEVTLTRSGVQALKAHRDALEGENPFDVAILDLNVPGELDGAGTMERIRMLDSQISGILSTAYIEHSVFSNYQKYGFQVAIRKPHDFSELSRILYNLTANNKSRPSTI